jgi:nucleoside-diphosphate-sugar epimerase
VRDVSRAFQHGIDEFDSMRGQVFNVGLSDANVSKRQLCERIRRCVPDFTFIDAPVGKDPDQRNYVVSNAKLEATGFTTTVSLDAGIAELVKGFTMIRNTMHGNV